MKPKVIIVFSLILLFPFACLCQNNTQEEVINQDSLSTKSIMFVNKTIDKRTQTVPKAYSYDRLGMFCKLDVILQRKNNINIHFRLPSKNY